MSAKKLAYAKTAVATRREGYERGKAIADKIEDDSLHANVGSFVLYRAALSFLADKDLQKPLDIAPRIDDASRKAVVKIAIARAMTEPKPNQVGQTEQTSWTALTKIVLMRLCLLSKSLSPRNRELQDCQLLILYAPGLSFRS